jgi:hypothetical protein
MALQQQVNGATFFQAASEILVQLDLYHWGFAHFILRCSLSVNLFRVTTQRCGFMELLVQEPFQVFHLVTSTVSRARARSRVASARRSSLLNTAGLGTLVSTSRRLLCRRSTRRTLLRDAWTAPRLPRLSHHTRCGSIATKI